MNTAHASILINASQEKVWQALTKPEMVKQYLFGTDMKTTWKVGDPIIYSGMWQGKPYEDKGIVKEFSPMSKIVTLYWSPGFGVPDLPENYRTVTYEVTPTKDGSKVTITQANCKNKEEAEHSSQNWTMVLGLMKKILETA
jgi:uncharacterized protein YndB with AHSA1/START domain